MLASNSMFSRRMVLKAGALISVYPASRLFAQTPEPLKNRLTSRVNDALWLRTVSYPH